MNITPGAWMIKPEWLQADLLAAKAPAKVSPKEAGIEIIGIYGPMSKGGWYGADTVAIREQVEKSANDQSVAGIMLVIDSPGGHVSGTKELADAVAAATKQKPVLAYAEDLMASAAYWVGSQADAIVAYPMAEVGSIGTVAVVYDQAGAAEKDGVKVHVISTGPHKGAFAGGAPVLPEHLEDLASRVQDMNAFFQSAVTAGRGLKGDKLAAVSTGQAWIASKAQALGLVDQVGDMQAALKTLNGMIQVQKKKAKALAELGSLKHDAQSRRVAEANEQAATTFFGR